MRSHPLRIKQFENPSNWATGLKCTKASHTSRLWGHQWLWMTIKQRYTKTVRRNWLLSLNIINEWNPQFPSEFCNRHVDVSTWLLLFFFSVQLLHICLLYIKSRYHFSYTSRWSVASTAENTIHFWWQVSDIQ